MSLRSLPGWKRRLVRWPGLLCGWLAAGGVAFAQPLDTEGVRERLESAASHLAIGQPREALADLERVAEAEPGNPWMLFFKGSAYFQLGDPYEALAAYDTALVMLEELGDPDPELAEKIRFHRYRARQQVFSIRLSTGLGYDTNVAYLGSGASGPGLITGRPDGVFGSRFKVDYAPIATAEETLSAGARLGHSWHFSIEEFDLQEYGGYVRYARRLGSRWEAAVEYNYDLFYLGNDPFVSVHGVGPSISYDWARSGGFLDPRRTTFAYRYESRNFLFETDPEYDQDANANSVGVEQTFKLLTPHPNWSWDLAAGYRFESASTDGTEFDRSTHDFNLGLGIPLVNPDNFTDYLILPDRELLFGFNVNWQLGDYWNDSLIDAAGRERRDLITTYTWSLSQVLLDSPRTGKLVLSGLINWADAHSNVETRDRGNLFFRGTPFTYDKVVYGAQLEWSW